MINHEAMDRTDLELLLNSIEDDLCTLDYSGHLGWLAKQADIAEYELVGFLLHGGASAKSNEATRLALKREWESALTAYREAYEESI